MGFGRFFAKRLNGSAVEPFVGGPSLNAILAVLLSEVAESRNNLKKEAPPLLFICLLVNVEWFFN